MLRKSPDALFTPESLFHLNCQVFPRFTIRYFDPLTKCPTQLLVLPEVDFLAVKRPDSCKYLCAGR